jgi:hypothetical protein
MKTSKFLNFLSVISFSSIILSCGTEDVNPLPDFTVSLADKTTTIAENSPEGTVVATFEATTDATTDVNYSILSQNPVGAFKINTNTGEVTVDNSTLFDFEGEVDTLKAEVIASIGTASDTAELVVTLTNVDEIITFTDLKFKAAVLALDNMDQNNDDQILESEAAAFTGNLQIANQEIDNIDELPYFPNISRLSAFRNNIKKVDLSKCTKVEQVLLELNDLEGHVDLSNCSVLTDFKVHSNNLTSLNIANGNNSNLTRFEAQGNDNLNCVQIDAGFTAPDGFGNVPASLLQTESCD